MIMEYPPIPQVTGLDGKRYPVFALTAAERQVLVDVVHALRHEHGYSTARIMQHLAEHGVPRARGTIHTYLAERCSGCAEHNAEQLREAAGS
jgi:hypothetical protein